jgi:ISXO2-like transposase domain
MLTRTFASHPGPGNPNNGHALAAHIVLPWIHRAFSLMKRWSLGTYHGLRRKHVDTYLNEFVFRYNRRFYRHVSFETLLGLVADKAPTSYWDVIKRNNPRKSAERSSALETPHIDEPESTG